MVFALTVSLIFLTFLLVVTSSRLEEHLRRHADLYKIQIGISAMLEAKFPDSYFDPIKLGESLEIFNGSPMKIKANNLTETACCPTSSV